MWTNGSAVDVTARVMVTESGLITVIRVAYDAPFDGKTIRVGRRHRVVAAGETPVERPAWATAD